MMPVGVETVDGSMEGFPRQLGPYLLLSKIATGGMASVYLAQKSGAAGFARTVAVKCCHQRLRSDQVFATMFLDEARLAARIHHPNVVATLDVSDGDPLYLVMDYVEGESLAALRRRCARRRQPIPIDVSLRIVSDVLSGLHAAHESCDGAGNRLGLVHCDVSPQNILVGVDGVSRITDFGIARAAARARDRDVIGGKLAYMAPEQLQAGRVNRRTDVYGAGVVLWEALAGRPLFRREDDSATVAAVMGADTPLPSTFNSGVPKALDGLVLRAIARHSEMRFETAADFLTEIERLPLAAATPRAAAAFVRAASESAIPTSRPPERPAIEERSDTLQTESRVRRHEEGASAVAVPERASDASDLANAVEVADADILDGATVEELTPIGAPTDELLARARRDSLDTWRPLPGPVSSPPSSREGAASLRRIILAVSLILVGCAVGLLVATGPAQPRAAPPVRAATSATSR